MNAGVTNGVYVETKGHLTEEDRRKMKAVKAANPELDIRFVFQAPYNKIYKGSKTTYAKWCEKHGFKWAAFHSIPIEWLTAWCTTTRSLNAAMELVMEQ